MESILAMFGFVLVSTVTPGPNNLMVLASGANWGLARTVPHILGIAVGFPVMIVLVGLGFGYVFDAYPAVDEILKYVAFAYLAWLAWKIAFAGKPKVEAPNARPLNFLEAAGFQWLNPKAWALVIGGLALYTTAGPNRPIEIALLALLFGLVCVPNGVVWCLFGRAISGFLQSDRRRIAFNVSMAVLLVLSALPTLL